MWRQVNRETLHFRLPSVVQKRCMFKLLNVCRVKEVAILSTHPTPIRLQYVLVTKQTEYNCRKFLHKTEIHFNILMKVDYRLQWRKTWEASWIPCGLEDLSLVKKKIRQKQAPQQLLVLCGLVFKAVSLFRLQKKPWQHITSPRNDSIWNEWIWSWHLHEIHEKFFYYLHLNLKW